MDRLSNKQIVGSPSKADTSLKSPKPLIYRANYQQEFQDLSFSPTTNYPAIKLKNVTTDQSSQKLSFDRSQRNLNLMTRSPKPIQTSEQVQQLLYINNPLMKRKGESLKRILQEKKRLINEEQDEEGVTSQGSGTYGGILGRNQAAQQSQSQTSEGLTRNSVGPQNHIGYLSQFEIKSGSGIAALGKKINPLMASIERKNRRNHQEYQKMIGNSSIEKKNTAYQRNGTNRIDKRTGNQRINSGLTNESTGHEVSKMLKNYNTRSVKILGEKAEEPVRNFHLPKISNASSPQTNLRDTPAMARGQSLPYSGNKPADTPKHGATYDYRLPSQISDMDASLQYRNRSYKSIAERDYETSAHLRLEAIRRQELRLYQAQQAKAKSIKEAEAMGLPKPADLKRTKLFGKQYSSVSPLDQIVDDSQFQQYMMTHDRFKHIEEYDHILKRRNAHAGIEESNAQPQSITEVDSQAGQDANSPIRHSDDEDESERMEDETGEHNESSKDLDFKRPQVHKGEFQKYPDDNVSKSHRTPTTQIRSEGRRVKTQDQSKVRADKEEDYIDREKIQVNSPYYDINQQVGFDDIRSFRNQATKKISNKETPPQNRDSRKTLTSNSSPPRKIGKQTPGRDSLVTRSANSLVMSKSSAETKNRSNKSVDYQQSFVNIEVLVCEERLLSSLIRSLARGQNSQLQQLDELEQLITPEINDYGNYLTDKENKVLANSSKVLLFSTCFFKLLCQYKAPPPKHQSGAQTNFENIESEKKFVILKSLFRTQMLNITRYLHETHLILCKYVFSKIQNKKELKLQKNKWVIDLQEIVDNHFKVGAIGGRSSVGENVVKKQMMKEGQFVVGTTNAANSLTIKQRQENRVLAEELHEQTLNAIFAGSKIPIQLIKQNNVIILSITKKLLSDKFIKAGIFETMWLTVLYWNKVNLKSMRHFLKMESKQNNSNVESGEMTNRQNDEAGKLGKAEQMSRKARMQGGWSNDGPEKSMEDSYLNYGDYDARQQQRITKYETKKGFGIDLTSAGLTHIRVANETSSGGYQAHSRQRPDLPQVYPPFLPPADPSGSEYCLVLDLDETLIHYVDNGPDSYFLVRPYCKEFLAEMSKYYEIVIFTAGVQEYADWVIDQIDPEEQIKHRLYREHTVITQAQRAEMLSKASSERAGTAAADGKDLPILLKDLSKLGRNISKTIIVDNIAENFQMQPDNGIFIGTWHDDPYDTELKDLIPLLKQIVLLNVGDVRKSLKDFRDQMLRMISEGNSQQVEVAKEHLAKTNKKN